ncbi:MAG TPA: ABC transporter permease [Acidobacteriaceae bacterium]|jgi:predicted permease|nr:ABC transporter permease [Acidobacteriaceae bacterium]
MLEDIRYALRQFFKTPGFTLTAILTLALGIGATTAVFTLINAVLLKSLPVAKPSELIRIGDTENCCINGGMQDDWSLFSTEQYREFRDHTPGFSSLAAFQAGRSTLGVRRAGTDHSSQPLGGEFVSGNAFQTFGLSAWAGRLLQPSDDQKGAAPVAVMSYRTWQQKYGKDPSIVGATFLINGNAFTIVGIAPPGFFGERLTSDPPSFWIPLSDSPLLTNGSFNVLDSPEFDWLNLIGRVQPGANLKQMEAQLQVELRQFLLSPISKVEKRDASLIPKQTLHLAPGGGGVQQMQESFKDGLHLAMWISAFVLLIACANLANLMLVRATARKGQTSVRSALGAPRSRLVRQALTESIVLAVLGGLAGLAVAYGGARLLIHMVSGKSYIPINASPSLTVLGFAFAVSLITGVLFGVAPAWMTAHADPIEALRGANRSTRSSGLWTQKILVVLQAAVSLALLCAAGLLIRSLTNLQNQHFGFETRNRYILHIDPLMAGYKADQAPVFFRQLHDTLAAIPGVKEVTYSLYSPMEGDNWGNGVYIEGQAPAPPGSNFNSASWDRVSAHYFDNIGTKIIAGRGITDDDTRTSQAVAVVNETFAKHFFKNGDAIGHHFGDLDQKYSGNFTIVGITEDTQYWDPTSHIHAMFYLPADQWAKYDDTSEKMFEDVSHLEMSAVEIQTVGFVPGLESQVRHALTRINPNLAVLTFESFADQVKDQFLEQEILVQLTTVFGFLALTLAAIGLYGVTAYSVAQRTREIGIRMALGADRKGIVQLVLRSAFLQAAIGLAIGMPAAIFGSRFMASLLYNVRPWDPVILIGATVVLAIAAFLAAVIPARRAAGVEPMTALRVE